VNLKLTSACVIGGVVALATSSRALTGVAATDYPSSTSDGAGDNSNPYAIIVDRNIFRLSPPPPPKSVDQKPVDLPKVYLNGIIKIGDDVRVLFSIPPKDAKSQTAYFKLAPGEEDGVLELVKIHPDQQAVDVLVSGTAMTLSMLSNTLASTGGKAAGGATAPGPGAHSRLAAPPAPAAAAAAPAEGPSTVVVGGDRNSSSYDGGVTVSGGGGGVTAGGGGNANFTSSGRGVSVSGGGGVSVGSTSFGGGGVSVSGGATSSSSSSSSSSGSGLNTSMTQIANTLASGMGTEVSDPAAQQAANMIIHNALLGGNGPPLPPPIAAAAAAAAGGSGDLLFAPPPPP
jgi:hypothetical protein